MDYEKKYNEALKKATIYYDNAKEAGDYSAIARYENIFPELAESEDERIRKELKEAFEAYDDIESKWNGIPIRSIFAWLEKQKESLHISETCKENADSFTDDEKIRKALISLVDENAYTYKSFAGVDLDSMLVYLEKQKAKERLDRMAPIYNDKESFESALEKAWKYYNDSASRTVDSFEDDYIECVFSKGFREGFLYKEKQKEQKPVESISQLTVQGKGFYKICPRCKEHMVRDDSKVYTSMPPQYGYECPRCGEIEFDTVMYDNPEMKEQKPTAKAIINGEPVPTKNYSVDVPLAKWSEEDENKLNHILEIVHIASGSEASVNEKEELESFLKSLPHVKQEWNEEDEKMLEEIINHIYTTSVQRIPARPGSDIGKSWIKFLKSLRPSWKPSEEQMEALRRAVNKLAKSDMADSVRLSIMYDHLKGLM